MKIKHLPFLYCGFNLLHRVVVWPFLEQMNVLNKTKLVSEVKRRVSSWVEWRDDLKERRLREGRVDTILIAMPIIPEVNQGDDLKF